MNFDLSEAEKSFAEDVEKFFQKELSLEAVAEINGGLGFGPKTVAFLKRLGARRWLTPMVPKEYGGMDGTWMQRHFIREAIDYYFFPVPLATSAASIVAPTLMLFGTDEQKKDFVPRIASGELAFALGYTEPEAGSDTANISIRAVEDGDHYVINGQKTFNTGCHFAQFHWLCARTEDTKPRHKGLSLFMVPMDSPGITMRPLWTMAGERTNEVFYDNVRVPKRYLIGEKNKGFYQMMAALRFERVWPVAHVRRALEELVKWVQTASKDGKPLGGDPLVRQRLAELAIRVEAATNLTYRVVWMLENGKAPDWEAPVNKVFITELEQDIAYTGLRIMGPFGQLSMGSTHAPQGGVLDLFFLSQARRTVSGGTNEILRTLIAQRGLGLPSR